MGWLRCVYCIQGCSLYMFVRDCICLFVPGVTFRIHLLFKARPYRADGDVLRALGELVCPSALTAPVSNHCTYSTD